jgi:hypothetical protein
MDQVKHCTVRIERLPLPPCWVLVERYEPPIPISEPWTIDDLITPPPSPPQDLDDDPIARQLASMGA